ncbi:hypothetical protein PT974_02362 [Cladobotryum mycophilum]|uniref:Uncharacterized protein n=1 Tax=Cladobotryum mycophilum TaxID=491253 RepID=A0ABR0SXY0_9HYPO
MEATRLSGQIKNITCEHKSHRPHNLAKIASFGAVFPHCSIIPGAISPIFPIFNFIKITWELPLLDLKPRQLPTLDAMREELRELPESVLLSHKLCRHVSLSDMGLTAALESNDCGCFFRSAASPKQIKWCVFRSTPISCKKHGFHCPECDTIYEWRRKGNRIFLKFTYDWASKTPTGPPWLNFLDDDSWNSLFDEETRHFALNNGGSHPDSGLVFVRGKPLPAEYWKLKKSPARCFIAPSHYGFPHKWALDEIASAASNSSIKQR